MTRVTGTLHHVLGNAEAITEVWVRSARARGHGGGWLMKTSARTPITDAHLSLDIVPGPAILVAVAEGQPLEHIEIIVPDTESASLEICITAAQGTGGQTAEALDLLRQQIADDLGESAKAVTDSRAAANDAEASAQTAGSSASKAGQSATRAASSASMASASESRAAAHAGEAGAHASAAGESAKTAEASASAAADSAGTAKTQADRAADRASAAAVSATEAGQHADRAESIPEHVDWHGDRLMVMGKISPPLTGPRGERGPQGDSGASTWDAITGKPNVATRDDLTQQGLDYLNALHEKADKSHQHRMADITDLPTVSDAPTRNTLVKRSSTGTVRVADPAGPNNAANQGYVDRQDAATLAEAKALVDARVRLVSSLPSRPDPNVLYVIPE